MTNISPIISELSFLMNIDEDDAAKYSDIINNTVVWIKTLLKSDDNSSDARIIHLCAVKAYYQIILMQEDEICSFSAGDVSYSKNSSTAEKAEKLLETAMNDCSDLLKSTGFAFKVV